MTKDEAVQYIADRLREVDEKSSTNLVNFSDDEIDWNEVARVALDAAIEIFELE